METQASHWRCQVVTFNKQELMLGTLYHRASDNLLVKCLGRYVAEQRAPLF